MPEISRLRLKITGHRIEGNKIFHFTAPLPPEDGSAPLPIGIGAPEIVASARAGVIPDDSVIEIVTKYAVVTVGSPPVSEVAVSPANELA